MRPGEAAGKGYDTGVRHALATAGLFFACVAPAVQLAVFAVGVPRHPHPATVWAMFGVHALVCAAAASRRLPRETVLVSWAAVAVAVAAQLAAAGVADPVAPGNISMTIAAAAALLLPLRRALPVTVAVSLATSAALVAAASTPTLALWSTAIQLPVYSVGVCAALGLAFRELLRVAGDAEDEARAHLAVDRAVRRKEMAAEAARRRARTMHDTIVNTLGAIANGRITSADRLVARRCADDARMVDLLRRTASSVSPSAQDVWTHAADLGVDLVADDAAGLRDRLAAEPSWRRREIVAALREVVTNVAKHAGVAHAVLRYDASSSSIVVGDTGVGMSDTAPVMQALTSRADDAQAQVQVTSAPGRGTTVRLHVPPLRETATGLFATASASMTKAITTVMLVEFGLAGLVIVACLAEWTPAAVAPPVLTWLLVAAILTVLLRSAGRAPVLPGGVVAATYAGLAAIVAVYRFSGSVDNVCGLGPNLAWPGNVVAIVCVVLVVVDGRVRVVLPAVLLTGAAVVLILGETAPGCGGSTLGLFITDMLVIGAFAVVRRETLRLTTIAAAHHRDGIRRRDEQERLAVDEALADDGFDTTLQHSRDILLAVAERPDRVRDPQLRAAAGLEETYLRALIGLTGDIVTAPAKQRFVAVIDVARAAGVGVSVHAEPGVLDDDSAGRVLSTVRDVVERCRAGDRLSIGIFGPRAEPSLMIVAPPHALVGYPHAADTTVTAELGLVEVRWSVGAYRDRR